MRDRPHRAPKVVFLPGASGDRDFWAPVANQLPSGWRTTLLSWPGAGDQPHDRHVRGFDDLIALVAGKLDERSDLVAQSRGGSVGRRLAELLPAANLHVLTAGAHTLARDRPDEVARLVIDQFERPIRT